MNHQLIHLLGNVSILMLWTRTRPINPEEDFLFHHLIGNSAILPFWRISQLKYLAITWKGLPKTPLVQDCRQMVICLRVRFQWVPRTRTWLCFRWPKYPNSWSPKMWKMCRSRCWDPGALWLDVRHRRPWVHHRVARMRSQLVLTISSRFFRASFWCQGTDADIRGLGKQLWLKLISRRHDVSQ